MLNVHGFRLNVQRQLNIDILPGHEKFLFAPDSRMRTPSVDD